MAFNAVSITDSATLIVDSNEQRKGLVIVNNSAKLIFIGPDDTITINNALPLFEYQSFTKDKIPEGWLGPIYAIVETGTANVRYWEI